MLIPYTAPRATFQKELEIKKSIFLATLIPVKDEEEAQEAIAKMKKEKRDATHNCSAYRIGTERIYEKSSDDGEPQGTAGHPMLHVLQMNELTNTLAIVTRWFGGIKLGAGGLTRAYTQSLADAVKEADLVRYTPHEKYTVSFPYTTAGAFENHIKGTDIIVKDRQFSDKVTVTFLTLPDKAETHTRWLTDATGGKAEIQNDGEEYVMMEVERE
ncbi:YigZ family protein [Dialister hominis]|uniref:IMPACT family member YvyE n=1 Tax=Dialister hominis TaxID=2582419 RepID=A0A8D4UWH2_9FIRM|nr:YigZ family protein [Dialister hominis]BBK26210.1 IMPACT family member YvyE [Dialister hominis]